MKELKKEKFWLNLSCRLFTRRCWIKCSVENVQTKKILVNTRKRATRNVFEIDDLRPLSFGCTADDLLSSFKDSPLMMWRTTLTEPPLKLRIWWTLCCSWSQIDRPLGVNPRKYNLLNVGVITWNVNKRQVEVLELNSTLRAYGESTSNSMQRLSTHQL